MKENAHNAEYTKRLNRNNIINMLRNQPMSRAELSKRTGLTRAAITMITRDLIDDGILTEGEISERKGKGKSPTPLSVVPSACYAVGIFLSRVKCLIGITDFEGNVITQQNLSFKSSDGMQTIKNEIDILFDKYKDLNVIGIGISSPGPLDTEKGMILNPPYFDDWQNVPIVSYLNSAFNIPVYLENDANILALYHLHNDISRDFLLLLVEDGIGSGIITDGRLLISSGHYSSELGHTTIMYNGKQCVCGNLGCLEAYASIPNLLADTGKKYTSWNEIIDAHDDAVLDLEADYLSAGIVNVKNMINIDTVYLAGSIKYGFDQLAPRLTHRISKHSMTKKPINILPSYHTSDIGVAAAANLVYLKYLEQV